MQYMKVSFFNYYVCTNSVLHKQWAPAAQQELQQQLHNSRYSGERKQKRPSASQVGQAMAAPAPAATAANANEAKAKASEQQPHQQ